MRGGGTGLTGCGRSVGDDVFEHAIGERCTPICSSL